MLLAQIQKIIGVPTSPRRVLMGTADETKYNALTTPNKVIKALKVLDAATPLYITSSTGTGGYLLDLSLLESDGLLRVRPPDSTTWTVLDLACILGIEMYDSALTAAVTAP
jgi:hypothetical protein